MKKLNLLFALFATVSLTACESEPEETLKDSINASDVASDYDLANSVIPYPNDLLFKDTLDGTLNIPVLDPADLSDPAVALNGLDGFSTVAPMSAGFTGAIDSNSINGDSVRVYQVTLSSSPSPGGAVVAVNTKLTFGVDYFATLSSVDSTNSTLVILPLKPLAPKSHYYVVMTNSLLSNSGNPVGPSASYILTKTTTALVDGFGVSTVGSLDDATAAQLEPLRQAINVGEATVDAFDGTLLASDIILSWSFTTQSAGDVLSVVRGLAGAPATTLTASTVNLGAGVGLSYAGAANVFTGTIDVPYYLTAATGVNDPTPLVTYWQSAVAVGGENNLTNLNPLPVATATETIPLLVTTPVDTGTYPAPWKTVIFQHGITSNRTVALAMVDSLALAGFAVVSIDMPLHGVDSTSSFYSSGNERTFDLDLVTQDVDGNITAAVPDSSTDTSGAHYINLSNLLNTRDNLRQSVADLFAVTAAISTIDVDGGGADLDDTQIYFVGHSLGSMVGTVFTALEPTVLDSVLAFGGASLVKTLDGSAFFGPTLAAGLAAENVIKGTPDYESFLGAAQTVVDSAEPANYAATAATGRGVLFFEIVGGSSSPSDLVVPNTVPDANDTAGTVPAPLAGTEALLTLMGLTHVNTTTAGSDLTVVTKFISGDHSSLLDPTGDAAVTTEIQTQAAGFLATGGATLVVTDDTVLLAP